MKGKKLLLSLLNSILKAAKIAFTMTCEIFVIALKVLMFLLAIAAVIAAILPIPGIGSKRSD